MLGFRLQSWKSPQKEILTGSIGFMTDCSNPMVTLLVPTNMALKSTQTGLQGSINENERTQETSKHSLVGEDNSNTAQENGHKQIFKEEDIH